MMGCSRHAFGLGGDIYWFIRYRPEDVEMETGTYSHAAFSFFLLYGGRRMDDGRVWVALGTRAHERKMWWYRYVWES